MRSILYTLFISALATVASAFPTHSGTCLSDGPTIQGVSGSPMGKLVTTLGYNFQTTMKNYQPGGPAVKFSVTGKTAFMGLLLYAVDTQKNHVGTWNTPKGYQFLGNLAGAPCKGDTGSGTLTHTDSSLKGPGVDFEWTPPSSDIGPIMFVGTLVQSGTAGFQIVKTTNFTVAGSKVTSPPSSGDNSTTSGGTSSPTSTSDSPYGSGSNSTGTTTGASATSHSDASSLTRSALLLQLTAVISLFLYYL